MAAASPRDDDVLAAAAVVRCLTAAAAPKLQAVGDDDEVDSARTSPTAASTSCCSCSVAEDDEASTPTASRSASADDVDGAAQTATGEAPATTSSSSGPLRLRGAAAQVAHPEKTAHGGEDSYFLCASGSALGVADGVSEWGLRFGVDPRAFADGLMHGASTAAAAAASAAEGASPAAASAEDRARGALAAGFEGAEAFGAATAVVATLDAHCLRLGAANLGDAGLRLLRRRQGAAAGMRWEVVGCTKEQLHGFNQPFQLSRLPQPADFPQLYAEGKAALVQAVKRCRPRKFDTPSDAELYSWEVLEGDLVVAGSDGVFDNLHDHEICEIVDSEVAAQGQVADPAQLASAIAGAAAQRSKDGSADTPFSQYACENGFEYMGGIQDDITVVAAWIAR